MGTTIQDRIGPEPQGASTQTLETEREKFLTLYRKVLREVVPERVWATMEQAHLFTDYAPLIKQVAEADEAQAMALVQNMQEKKGRRTRNSALSSYVRTLYLSEDGKEGLAALCFREVD